MSGEHAAAKADTAKAIYVDWTICPAPDGNRA
jgi:hypothetical protein